MSEPRRQAFRLDVNAEITVRLADLGRDLKLTLVDISDGGGRLRSTTKLPPHTRVAFAWMGPSRQPIPLSGRVVAVRMSDPKTAEYGIQFDMSEAAKDKLAHELAEVQRRKAYKPADMPAHQIDDGDVGGRAKRQGYRAAVTFNVVAKVPNKDGRIIPVRAEALDLSIGGMLIAMPGEYEEGIETEISFTMPVGAVDMGGEEKEVMEQTPFGERRVKKLVPVRPFDPISCKAKIVKKTGSARNGVPTWGIGFADLSAFLKEEIARFVHAHQLSQLRKAAATQG
ncbi:MAG TPA: PilZ domain-containing protein [Candidatus Baltobacteraceae bacterium]|jgi:c-di-GMP-binding flagellar brake protein YcgR